jgi:hypothetical protein
MRLACSLARAGNKLIAKGTDPKAALARVRKAFKLQTKNYDSLTESDNGCNAAGQAKWQADIDGDKLSV